MFRPTLDTVAVYLQGQQVLVLLRGVAVQLNEQGRDRAHFRHVHEDPRLIIDDPVRP